MGFLVAFIGGLIGRALIGGLLNFMFKPEEHENPNPENWLGWIGFIAGVAISLIIYNI